MSLDVYLEAAKPVKRERTGIYIRENGQIREITQFEWDAKFPGAEPVAFSSDNPDPTIYTCNITHNLGRMADAAGLYGYLWEPEENGIMLAKQLIEPLTEGLAKLRAHPTHFKMFNPSNDWGSYDGLVRFVDRYLEACREHMDARVRVSR